jgi:SAM-dependent methyltransferase
MLKKLIRRALNSLGYDVVRYEESGGTPEPPQGSHPPIRPEFAHLELGGLALQRLLDGCQFETVLDIGCGAGEHSDIFVKYGKQVTAVDFGRSAQFGGDKNQIRFIAGDFNEVTFPTRFDCVWACHVLEHQLNVNSFLRRVFGAINDDGVLAITVPPLKHQIVGGHVNLWNGGLLLYNLVLAGFDCREARLFKYGYNISVIVKKKLAPLPTLAYDTGDIDRIAHFLPRGLREQFDGDIEVIDH